MNKEPLFIGDFRQDGRKAKENRELKVKMDILYSTRSIKEKLW